MRSTYDTIDLPDRMTARVLTPVCDGCGSFTSIVYGDLRQGYCQTCALKRGMPMPENAPDLTKPRPALQRYFAGVRVLIAATGILATVLAPATASGYVPIQTDTGVRTEAHRDWIQPVVFDCPVDVPLLPARVMVVAPALEPVPVAEPVVDRSVQLQALVDGLTLAQVRTLVLMLNKRLEREQVA